MRYASRDKVDWHDPGVAPLLEIANRFCRFRATCPGVEIRWVAGGSTSSAGKTSNLYQRPQLLTLPAIWAVGMRAGLVGGGARKKDSDTYGPLTCPHRSTIRAVGIRRAAAQS